MPTPEFVIIGKQGQGKSTLIEALVGAAINHVTGAAVGQLSSKRPVFVSLVAAAASKIVLRRDLSVNVAGSDRDLELDSKEVAAELAKRQTTASSVPIYLVIENKQNINVTLIDTPGLDLGAATTTTTTDQQPSASELEETVLSLVRPAYRHIIGVEEANDWSKLTLLNFIKKVDPSLTRSTLVLTKFNQYLKTLNATLKLNRFFASQPRDVQCFFVSLFSAKVRENNLATENYQAKVYQGNCLLVQ